MEEKSSNIEGFKSRLSRWIDPKIVLSWGLERAEFDPEHVARVVQAMATRVVQVLVHEFGAAPFVRIDSARSRP